MSREPGDPALTGPQFEQLLTDAQHGVLVSDQDVGWVLWDALVDIADAAPDVPAGLIAAARRAFAGTGT